MPSRIRPCRSDRRQSRPCTHVSPKSTTKTAVMAAVTDGWSKLEVRSEPTCRRNLPSIRRLANHAPLPYLSKHTMSLSTTGMHAPLDPTAGSGGVCLSAELFIRRGVSVIGHASCCRRASRRMRLGRAPDHPFARRTHRRHGDVCGSEQGCVCQLGPCASQGERRLGESLGTNVDRKVLSRLPSTTVPSTCRFIVAVCQAFRRRFCRSVCWVNSD